MKKIKVLNFVLYCLVMATLSAFTTRSRCIGEDGKEVQLLSIESSLDKDVVYIGDPVRYTFIVKTPQGAEVTFPVLEEKIVKDFEIKGTGDEEEESEEGKRWVKWYILQSFKPDSYTLPSTAVTVRFPDGKEESLKSSPLSLIVESLLDPSQPELDIREIKPPLALKVSYFWLFLLLGGGIILVGLVVFITKKVISRGEKLPPPPPPRPAHEIAYEELSRIKSENLPAQGKIKQYYTRVSDVVRHYLENCFGLRAPERTTEEFLIDMATTNLLSLKHQGLVGDFLAQCDLVKFAKYGPSEREIENVYNSAMRLVDETKEGSGFQESQVVQEGEGKVVVGSQ